MSGSFGFPAYSGREDFVFISYANKDADRVAEYARYLHENGINVWYDNGLDAGGYWAQQLMELIASPCCKAVILFVSEVSVTRPFVRAEVHRAFSLGKPILGVYLDDIRLDPTMDMYVSQIQSIRVSEFSGKRAVKENIWNAAWNLMNGKPFKIKKGTAFLPKLIAVFLMITAAAFLAVYFSGRMDPNVDPDPKPVMIDETKEPDYRLAHTYMESGHYSKAVEVLNGLTGYRDCDKLLEECHYNLALEYYDKGMTDFAADVFDGLPGYFKAPEFKDFSASSELETDFLEDFVAINAFDGSDRTSWQEGVAGSGAGEWVMCSSDTIQRVESIQIYNGLTGGTEEDYTANNRVACIRITTDSGADITAGLDDSTLSAQSIPLERPLYCKWIRFTIVEVYDGIWADDTVINDIVLQ